MKKLYVGNLPFDTQEGDILGTFSAYGEVHTIKMIMDRETGQFRGFSFIEMDEDAANEAMKQLDGQDFNGRPMKVNEATERPRGQSPRGGNWGGGPQRPDNWGNREQQPSRQQGPSRGSYGQRGGRGSGGYGSGGTRSQGRFESRGRNW